MMYDQSITNVIYTQIKIDEITNLGSVKIRLRSLIGAIEARENKTIINKEVAVTVKS